MDIKEQALTDKIPGIEYLHGREQKLLDNRYFQMLDKFFQEAAIEELKNKAEKARKDTENDMTKPMANMPSSASNKIKRLSKTESTRERLRSKLRKIYDV